MKEKTIMEKKNGKINILGHLKQGNNKGILSGPFFQFSEPIRKIMCTTNTVKSLNRQFKNICYDLDNKKKQNILLLLSWKVTIYKF